MNHHHQALNLLKSWSDKATVTLRDPEDLWEGSEVVVTWDPEMLEMETVGNPVILLWDRVLERGADDFDALCRLRSQTLRAAAVVVPSPEVRDSLWSRLSRYLCPLVLPLEAASLHKVALLAKSGRLAIWNLTHSRASHLYLQSLGEGMERGPSPEASIPKAADSWSPGSVLLVQGTASQAEALEGRGHQVLRHSFLPQDGCQTFALECVFAPSASFDYVLWPQGAEDHPYLEVALGELKRLARKEVVYES